LAEVARLAAALGGSKLNGRALAAFLPYHAVRADLLHGLGRPDEARAAYDATLALGPAEAERLSTRRKERLAALS
jgi:RNA polymerase sigma-70 factor (ECF subfamily)